jgi:hypothetical protein
MCVVIQSDENLSKNQPEQLLMINNRQIQQNSPSLSHIVSDLVPSGPTHPPWFEGSSVFFFVFALFDVSLLLLILLIDVFAG